MTAASPPADVLRTRWADILDATLQMVIYDPERRRLIAESLAGDVGVVRDQHVEQLESRLIAVRAEAEGLAEAMANADRLYTEHLAEERAKLARVRALHHPVTITGQVWCDECSTQRSTGPRTWDRIAYIPYPCRTVQALDGEAS